MVAAAPGLFSTTTCCFRVSAMWRAMARAEVSPAPPGGAGTTRWMGLDGNPACACADTRPADRPSPSRHWNKLRTIAAPPDCLIIGSLLASGRRARSRADSLVCPFGAHHIGHVVATSTIFHRHDRTGAQPAGGFHTREKIRYSCGLA